MNKDQVAGRVDQAKGKVKEVAGRATGNESLEAKGVADQASGKVQSTYGDVKEKAKDAIKSGADKL
ncbi:CsbD family protein [Variovorax guangxiensis]|uniref:CsbD family protein n=1 Tax=Variovorax guangxiensis TaxID=1775474 RepID=A0A502DSU3_9BURK|nr:CsbD family protein [Variovorax guangxiensis]RZI65777.1 MAG: CsbD family protein [Variovorax sp.]TPG24147.1 CsbD family protein [Variovorax ginsengisoli]TPG28397.1 CsbD family protein [Variovorax guangxiensis]